MAKPTYYNFRMAKRNQERKQRPAPMEVVLKIIESTPGAWGKIFDFQRQAYLESKREGAGCEELVNQEDERVNNEEMAKYFLSILAGLSQWP